MCCYNSTCTSGFNSCKFTFEGFLPKKSSERKKILLEISKNDKTTVLFESPHRLRSLLKELRETFGGQREIHISRELTKKFEEHIGKNINEVIEYLQDKEILGEITIVIKGANKTDLGLQFQKFELKKDLSDLVNLGLSLSKASKYLAKKIIYRKV